MFKTLALALILYAQNPWVDGLRNQQNSICCTNNDGRRLDDPDWDTLGKAVEDYNGMSGYRVLEDGEWKDVPNWAVVTQRNHDGIARVWWDREYQGADVIKKIRCFLPGTLG